MKYTIRQGEHRARPVSFGLWKDKIILERQVIFHDNCKYLNLGEDIQDINKLFGIGYLPGFWSIFKVLGGIISQRNIPDVYHHTDSARFGWTYNHDRNNILLHSYCYVNEKLLKSELLHVPMETRIHCRIVISKYDYQFNVDTPNITFKSSVPYTHNKNWSYLLNPYFGGNLSATHDMDITLNKL